eukprot:GSChrysophyteH1.ASY1.ANO1.1936.1 assembled CDS
MLHHNSGRAVVPVDPETQANPAGGGGDQNSSFSIDIPENVAFGASFGSQPTTSESFSSDFSKVFEGLSTDQAPLGMFWGNASSGADSISEAAENLAPSEHASKQQRRSSPRSREDSEAESVLQTGPGMKNNPYLHAHGVDPLQATPEKESASQNEPPDEMDVTSPGSLGTEDSITDDSADDSENDVEYQELRKSAEKAAIREAMKNIPPVPDADDLPLDSSDDSTLNESDTHHLEGASNDSISDFEVHNFDDNESDATDSPSVPQFGEAAIPPPPPPEEHSGDLYKGQFEAPGMDDFDIGSIFFNSGSKSKSGRNLKKNRREKNGSIPRKGGVQAVDGETSGDVPPAWWGNTSMNSNSSPVDLPVPPNGALPDFTDIKKAEENRREGKDHYNSNNYAEALNSYCRAIHYSPKEWPTRAIIFGNRAATYMMLQRFVEAASDCESALASDPTMVKLHVRRGRCMLRLGMFSAVDDICARVLEMPPPVDQKVISPDQDVGMAKADAKKCLKDLATAKHLVQQLNASESILDYEGALSISESIMEICPQFKMAHTSKVKALNKLHRWEEAKTFAEQVTYESHVSIQKLTAHPKADLPIVEPAFLRWKLTSTTTKNPLRSVQKEVKVNLEKVTSAILAMDADLAFAYLASLKNVSESHSCCVEVMNKISAILENLSSVFRTQWAWVFREKERMALLLNQKSSADTFFKSNRFQEATLKYAGALKADPSAERWNAILHSNRAAAFMALNMHEDAVRDCHQAINKDPQYVRAYLRRARAFQSLNDYAAAVRDYRRYLSSSPTPADYDDVNEELKNSLASQARKTQDDQRRHAKERNEQERNARGAKSYGFPHGGASGTRGYDYRTDSDEYTKSRFFSKGSSAGGARGSHRSSFDTGTTGHSSYSHQSSSSSSGSRNGYGNSGSGSTGYSSSSRSHPAGGAYGRGSRSGSYKNPPVDSDGEQIPDHYKTLGVSRNATDSEIRKAYHQAALKYHPDKNKEAGAEEIFKGIGLAYSTLSDKIQRSSYDRKWR